MWSRRRAESIWPWRRVPGFEVVDDVAVFGVGDLGDAKFGGGVFSGEPAGVVKLAAAGGIEGGAVENERGTRGFEDWVDFGVEVVEEGVVVVEAVGHGKLSFYLRAPVECGLLPKS
jgi:hypothetical protein